MAASSPHTGFGSAALVRLLAQWGLTVPPGTAAPGVERLGQWLSWTDAVAVARVLSADAAAWAEGPPLAPAAAASASASAITAGASATETTEGTDPAVPVSFRSEPPAGAGSQTQADRQAEALEQEVQSHRVALRAVALALARPAASSARTRNPADRRTFTHAAAAADDPLDLDLHQRRYRGAQRELGDAVGSLRPRLRGALSGHGGAWAQLAALDAALDEAVSPRERQALTLVGSALARRFHHHRRAAESGAAVGATSGAAAAAVRGSDPAAPVDRPAGQAIGSASARTARPAAEPEWLLAFRTDQQRALLAELELRWAPVAGLVAALRAARRSPAHGHPLDHHRLDPHPGRRPEPQADRQAAPVVPPIPPASA